ncbi:MAG: hypothetical protein RMI56_04385 [Sulfolobales archaeon]|nr:hypothetical protein [Sulfolobales archaeon]MDW8083021.1 hypothetical protein [Sulfolobales archaeon]
MRAIQCIAILTLAICSIFSISVTESSDISYPPTYSRRAVVWRDGDSIWILDVVAYSEMPWYIGKLEEVEISVKLTSYTSSREFEITLIARLAIGQRELVSRYLGSIDVSNRSISDRISLIVSPLTFPRTHTFPTTENLTITIEGYILGRQYTYVFSIPIVILPQSPDIGIRVSINNTEDYYSCTDTLARINFTAIVSNTGKDVVLGGVVRIYLNSTLIGEKPLMRMSPGESSSYEFSVFQLFNVGVYFVRVAVVYTLPGGIQREASSAGILEILRQYEVFVSIEKSLVVEGSSVAISGRVEPKLDGVAILEEYTGTTWVSIGVTPISKGTFRFQLKAGEVPIWREYVVKTLRVRVPLSLVGGRAEAVSRSIALTVFSHDRVLDMVTDISLDLRNNYIISGSSLPVGVRIRPQLAVCLLVKIAYRSISTLSWVELGDLEVCEGYGVVNLTIDFPAGRYLVKAIAISKYRVVESLPKELVVVTLPQILIEHPERVIYGEQFKAVVKAVNTIVDVYGFLEVRGRNRVLDNITLTFSEGRAEVITSAVDEVMQLRACVRVLSYTLCSQSNVTVIKPSISVSPQSVTVEVGQTYTISISATPGQVYRVRLATLRNGAELSSEEIITDASGKSTVTLRAPTTVGRYILRVSLKDSNVYSDVQLNVIEIVKSVNIELLTKNVKPLETVLLRVSITPQPLTPKQLVALLLSGDKWLPVAYEVAHGRSEIQISFKAPESEGTYSVRVEIPDIALVSNTVYLTVSRGEILSRELMYAAIALTAIAGAVTVFLRRRR